jgi:hypothetical protein
MVTDRQVRMLMKTMQTEDTLEHAAVKAGMDEKTARKYRELGQLPSEIRSVHTWRTREDPFEERWGDLREKLSLNPGLEAKTLFEDLQRRNPGKFADGQLRTLQRKVKAWRALEGPPKEVFFPQVYQAGVLCQSDFTHMNKLGITIQGGRFDHLVYHFVLPYSNWETCTVCFSESFESLSEGLQNALWSLGGVPRTHRTDRLSTAVHNTDHPAEFTQRYVALLRHYGLEGAKIQIDKPHENGDVEQRHHRLKRAVDQALMLRGSRDFLSREDYGTFLKRLISQLNAGRRERFVEEIKVLGPLPSRRLETCKRMQVRVGPSSTIRVNHNVYSVDSRLIGEAVEVRLYLEHLEIWYAQRHIESIPRLRGSDKHKIQYRHIIDWLARKPGAFENYRYREDLFPTHRFRMAYDAIKRSHPGHSAKEYLHILYLAARENETAVDEILRSHFDKGLPISAGAIEKVLRTGEKTAPPTEVRIADVDLLSYDMLLDVEEVACVGN